MIFLIIVYSNAQLNMPYIPKVDLPTKEQVEGRREKQRPQQEKAHPQVILVGFSVKVV